MKCDRADIKELLPSYSDEHLTEDGRAQVALHLETCEDCRMELALLGTIAEAPVPDPGEAFWAALPDTIYREVRRQEEHRRSRGLSGLLDRFLLPRWAWATAAVVLISIAAWYGIKPAPVMTAGRQLPDAGGVYVDVLASEQVRISDLDAPEIGSLESWAGRELNSLDLQNGVVDMFMNAPEGAIEERLADMNTQELEHLSSMLDTENEEGRT